MARRYRALPLVAAGLFAAGPLAAPAQAQRVTAGFLAGATLSKAAGDDVVASEVQTRTSFAAGLFAQLGTGRFALEPQAMFVTKGAKATASGTTIGARLRYLEFPLLATVRFLPGRHITPYLTAGPAVSVKLECTLRAPQGNSTTSVDCDTIPDFAVKSTEAGLVFGGGLDVGPLRLSARYEVGLTSIDGSTAKRDITNRSFLLLAGFYLGQPN